GPFTLEKVYFSLGQVVASGNDFAGSIKLGKRTYRPGEPVQATLVESNLTSSVSLLSTGGPFLPQKITCTVRDASGADVWQWHSMIPMIFTGPARDYVAAYDSIDYGPVTWPGTDQNGKAVAAGTYTIVMRFIGDSPKQDEV